MKFINVLTAVIAASALTACCYRPCPRPMPPVAPSYCAPACNPCAPVNVAYPSRATSPVIVVDPQPPVMAVARPVYARPVMVRRPMMAQAPCAPCVVR